MGTKKSNKLYAAAAALAVTASAVAPGLTADAATKVTVKSVTNPASISHYGGYTFAVKKLSLPKTVKVLLSNKKYENRSVKWGKVSYDKKYIGKYQTISGTVSGTTKKASIKVKLNNYPVDVVEPKLAPVAVGEKLNLPSTIDVKYKDGKVIARSAKSFNLTAEKTDKAGMMKLSYNYMGKNSSIKGSIAYEVKAAEITNVMNEIKDDMLSVSADVKYPAKDAKAEVLVYAFKDMTKEPIKVAAELKDGKLTAKSAVLPAGTHAFAVKVGEVVSPAKDFVIEAPMVKEVKAINATQLEVAFNKAVDAKSVFADGVSGTLATGVLKFRSIDSVTDGTLTGKLSEDGKTLVVTSTQLLEKRYDVEVDKVKTVTGVSVEKFGKILTIEKDTVAPSIVGTERVTATKVKVKFSEPMTSAGSTTFKLADGTVVSGITGEGVLVDGGMAVELDLSNTSVPVGKEIIATIIGAADKAGNLLTPNPATVSIQKGDKDGVAPTVSSVVQSGAKTFEITFSEALSSKPAVSLDGVIVSAANVSIDSKDAKKVTVDAGAVLTGDKVVTISGAVDGSGEVQAATNRVVKFVSDTVAPKIVSSAVVVDATEKAEYLELTFDKNVDLGATPRIDVENSSYVKDYVTTSIAGADLGPIAIDYKDAKNKKVLRVKLDTLLGTTTDVEGAKYALNFSLTGVTSEFNVAVTSGTSSFTRGKDGVAANTTVQTLASSTPIVQSSTNNSEIVVTFTENVDAATATNAANYIVGGAIVESATVNSANTKAVTLKLKADSNTFTGARNVTVQNVKAAGSSVAMNTATLPITLKENVAPTVTAKLGADLKTITLTFSEVVNNDVEKDFDVYSETTKLAGNEAVVLDPTTKKSATITLTNVVNADQLTKGISLKALPTIDIVDEAGNKLSVGDKVAISNN
ncbi:hypothetical protein ASF99_09300 [Exiguobacterium sp. Leaf187]|uniref:Ig-like domain-containing protein n=1 Tax=Exiguobacterium sp. Leaf187 TaxID=1736294 RepID=UPI0006F63729|nr:Ig-like domain-containing protein [Exiguobacterium sp. Leaf187]KQS20070.1 hypothetical protein ASF99_09300 [Exiguobacterium sp. Leaf187]